MKRLVVLATPLFVIGLAATASAQEPQVAPLQAAAKAAPRDAQAALALGRALRRAGRFDEALLALRRAAATAPAALADDARFEIARAYFDQPGMPGVYHRAHTACGALSQRGARFHVCEARAWNTWRRSSRAIEEAQAALRIDARNADAQVALGEAHRGAGNLREAEAAYRQAIEFDPASVEAQLGLAALLGQQAGHREDALHALRRAVELDGTSAVTQLALGRMLGRGDEALRALGAAVEARPNWSEARAGLGQALIEAGRIDEAIAQFREAIRWAADSAPAHTGLGAALLKKGQHPEAERELRRAIQLVPNDFAASLALADVLDATSRTDDAIEAYRHAGDLDPRNPKPLVRAGALCRRLGRNTVAAGFLGRALRIDDNLPRAHVVLGDILFDDQDFANAKRAYERALRGDPTGIDVPHVRERIGRLHEF